MKQEDIMALLVKASLFRDKKTWEQILYQFQFELWHPYKFEKPAEEVTAEDIQYADHQNDRAIAYKKILTFLFYEVEKNRPDLFPFLFPIFALLCGDREKSAELADIDWRNLEEHINVYAILSQEY